MKYTAALALVVWLAVAGWLASMVIAKPAVLRLGNQAGETAAMAELRNGINRNHQVTESIASLREATPYTGPTRALVALPPPPAAAPADAGQGTAASRGYGNAGRTGGQAVADPMVPMVSLVLDTDGQRSAIVNGQYVRAGSRLANGARVRAIGPDWVRIDDPSGSAQTFQVRNVLAPERDGGMQ
ncbi:hypothetical protein B1992_04690 [Pseudoxanthomonas broegbernensis]|uniref:Uncharacterized protein n=2 Tax=Pseudoxanthomonas broegbernensis TaxID=83619 RepID=A0A7V8K847_9GAMM|nr:hypothetical protein B1992_04690 [Pseudoxanthomonas broegbernensis]